VKNLNVLSHADAVGESNLPDIGFVLFEDPRIVVIATLETTNEKTGDMVQIWILSRAVNPVDAVRNGSDADVCLDCKHRGMGAKDRTCYVKVFQAPYAIWHAYQRGRYAFLSIEGYAVAFGDRKIRFGAYGEPVLIPLAIVAELSRVSRGRTGYTHQFANPAYQAYRAFIMASVDTPAEFVAAKALGWRTFRIRAEGTELFPREIVCPASDEAGKRTQCERCLLCSGTYDGDPRKDIAIFPHGSGAKKINQFIQIGA
jgi:hypothetical protein